MRTSANIRAPVLVTTTFAAAITSDMSSHQPRARTPERAASWRHDRSVRPQTTTGTATPDASTPSTIVATRPRPSGPSTTSTTTSTSDTADCSRTAARARTTPPSVGDRKKAAATSRPTTRKGT